MIKPPLGILMLDSRFPRILGDVGNPDSFDFPVIYRVVKGASPDNIVRADAALFLDGFIAAGRELVAQGCTGIATTCGFLSPLRAQLAVALGVPVASSALEQAAQIAAMLPAGQRVGILTISAQSLGAAHLDAANVPPGTAILGVEDTLFAAQILGNDTALDVEAARASLVAAAQTLVSQYKNIGAIVLECTNMPPYAADIAAATGRPVYSVLTYLDWFYGGLVPKRF